MSDDTESSAPPVSWDEAREALIVVLLVCAVLRMLGPLLGFIDERWGVFSDDLAELTRNASPTTGLMVIGAAVLVATTPRVDLVPSLRTATVAIAWIVILQAGAAILLDLWRVSGTGVLGRLESIFGRSLPALLLAGTGRWLASRVVPFDD